MPEIDKLFLDLLADFGRSLGMEELRPDLAGLCSLTFGEQTTVTMQWNEASGNVIVSSDIGAISPEHRAVLCERMMEANFGWRQTGGIGTLSLVPNDDPLQPSIGVLMYQTPLRTLDFTEFRSLCATFLETAEAWAVYLSAYAADPTIDASALPGGGNDPGAGGIQFLRV